MENILKYGVLVQEKSQDLIDQKREEFVRNGYAIFENFFDSDTIKKAKNNLDLLLISQISELGEEVIEKINDADLVRCPLASDDLFLDIACDERLISFISKLLGQRFVLLMQNGIINKPNVQHYQTAWHRDLNYQHWVSSKPIAINFLICLDDFFEAGGATIVLPGSHLHEEFPSDEFVRKNQVTLEAPEGSVIVMNCMTYHRSGLNSTEGFVRRALNHVVGLPFLGQQIDIPKVLNKRNKVINDAFLKDYLGFSWNPADDVQTWRLRKIK